MDTRFRFCQLKTSLILAIALNAFLIATTSLGNITEAFAESLFDDCVTSLTQELGSSKSAAQECLNQESSPTESEELTLPEPDLVQDDVIEAVPSRPFWQQILVRFANATPKISNIHVFESKFMAVYEPH